MDNKTYSQNIVAMAKQIKYLSIHGFQGLCGDFCELVKLNDFMQWKNKGDNFVPDCTSEYGMTGDLLEIKVPFAGTNFTVCLFFNLHEPWIPPDMIFSDTKFMKKILNDDLDNLVPCLNNWSYLSEDIIAQLLIQLHKLYKKYQLECLKKEEVLLFEYQSVLKDLEIVEDDTELSLSGGSSWLASLLIRLPLNLKDVPPCLIDANPGPPTCLLHVIIKKSNGAISPKLYLSPQVEALIGGSNTLALPSVPAGTSLSDYISNVLKLLEDRVKIMVLSFEIRKQLTAQLLCLHGTSLLEYDADKFERITFLLDWLDFNFILTIILPENFPRAQPIIILRSVYHLTANDVPITQMVPNVKLSTQATADEMAQYIHTAILDYLPTFKKESIIAM